MAERRGAVGEGGFVGAGVEVFHFDLGDVRDLLFGEFADFDLVGLFGAAGDVGGFF